MNNINNSCLITVRACAVIPQFSIFNRPSWVQAPKGANKKYVFIQIFLEKDCFTIPSYLVFTNFNLINLLLRGNIEFKPFGMG